MSSSANGARARRIAPLDDRHPPAGADADDDRRAGVSFLHCQRNRLPALQRESRTIAKVRPATLDDVKDVARIHKDRFDGPELALGKFSVSLISEFYASFLGHYIFLVHDSDCGVDGFVVGGERERLNRAERIFVQRNLPRCCLETLFHPRLWPSILRFARKLFLPRKVDFASFLAPNLPRLLSIAVDKSAERGGVATALIKAFESHISGNYRGYWLTVAKENHRAHRVYEKLGMTIVVDAFPGSFVFQKDFASVEYQDNHAA